MINLLKIAKFFTRLSVFAVVIVLALTFFPFIGGKYYFFRVSIELALAFVLLWWGFQANPGEAKQLFLDAHRRPLVIAVSVFVLFYVLAAIFAHDPHAAFWSNYERGEGAFQMLHYYVLFLLLSALFTTEGDWQKLFKYSIFAGALMILYGLLAAAGVSGFVGPYQDMGHVPTVLGKIFSQSRFQGSLGNPAYVAPYLTFIMFYGLWMWGTKKTNYLRTGFYALLNLCFFTFFILSQTRGAFLGFVAATLVFFAYIILSSEKLRKPALAIFFVLAIGLGTLWYFRGTPAVRSLPGSRLLDINLSDQTVQTRLWTWGSAWRGFKERPVLGWGPENFSTVFDKYFDPRHFIPGQSSETWFDRAHSIAFDYLAETGIFGLLSFFGIFAVFFYQFFRGAYGPIILRALLLALPVAYLVQGLTLFDVLPIYINLFIFLAFGGYYFEKRSLLQKA